MYRREGAGELLPLPLSPEWAEERKVRWGVTQPDLSVEGVGRFPDISDDPPILPKWIEAAQKRKLERTRRPIIAADVARFGDETVIMHRESRLDMGLPRPPQGGHPMPSRCWPMTFPVLAVE
jgi:hypothetical protein